MIRVFLKDGSTVFEFDDAKEFRALLHERPGHKPPNQGEALAVKTYVRDRESVGVNYIGETKVRYIARQSISHVLEGPFEAA